MASSGSEGVPVGKNLPWVEKYRPHTMNELVSHTEIIKTLTNLMNENRLPHLLFYGPPGTGKTSTILACARTMYSPQQYKSVVLELNASDDRGINVVREQIISFAQSKSLVADVSKCVKLVILDEADAMTKDAQNALRRVIEKYSDNVRFCMICNYLSKIIPAIQSRCTRFRFAPLKTEQIVPRLLEVANMEAVNMTDDGKEALLTLAEGDMRRVLNILQSTAMAFPVVNEENIYTCVGQPLPGIIKNILRILLNETVEDAIEQIGKMCSERCYALQDIVTSLHKLILLLDIPSKFVCKLITALADIEVRLAAGCSDSTQLGCLVATFMQDVAANRHNKQPLQKNRQRSESHNRSPTNMNQGGANMNQGYPGGYPGGYPPQGQGYPHQAPGYPQQTPGYPQQAPGFPQQGSAYQQQQQQQPQQHVPQPPPQSQPQPEQKRLNPQAYPQHLLDNLEGQSVERLTVIGKELTQDLTFRCLTLLNVLKASDRRMIGTNEPSTIIEYCVQVLNYLLKIRVILDKNPKVNKRAMTNEEWIAHMSGANGVPEKRADLQEKEDICEKNRIKLIELMTELKMVDWMASVSDPHSLAGPEPLR